MKKLLRSTLQDIAISVVTVQKPNNCRKSVWGQTKFYVL